VFRDRGSVACRYVLDDDKPPEGAFKDALIAFAETHTK